MKLYSPKVIKLFGKSIECDQYDDTVQREVRGGEFEDHNDLTEFVLRNIRRDQVLEVGCGGGKSFEVFGVTAAIEPNPKRFTAACDNWLKRKKVLSLCQAVAECLPFASTSFDTVLMIGVLEHCRSDFEALVEANRVLKVGGMLILALPLAGSELWPPCGRVYDLDQWADRLRDFGFSLVEKRQFAAWKEWYQLGGLAVEKVSEFDYRDLLKIQMVRQKNGLYAVNNLREDKWTLL